ncbi:isocitrate lyase and phosphorylmutase [Mrakia frigida]|uniref:isocitrate lyase and phosphorylmutase n=1 Tax=Mrakia frigida TaxID=29902 RepID=UPI003FCBF0CC
MSSRASSSRPPLLAFPTAVEEEVSFSRRIASLEHAWSTDERWKGLKKRSYSARDVVLKQGSLDVIPPASSLMARKLWELLRTREQEGKPVHTLGAIDPAQVTQLARAGLEVVYVSGWACSSLLTTGANEVGPDLGDYPYTTVPNQVQRLHRAQTLHDRIHYDERMRETEGEKRGKMERTDYLRPIIADGDAGHGGLSSVMKLAKLFAESGAAAVHLEDQLHGAKKCGHQSGKVLVPTSDHIQRLVATRLQWDILGSDNVLIARTDSESSHLLSSTVDPRDHRFLLGSTLPSSLPLAEHLANLVASGTSPAEIESVESRWIEDHKLMTFQEAVVANFQSMSTDSTAAIDEFLASSAHQSISVSRALAKKIFGGGEEVFWDCEAPKTSEGFYRTTGGIESAIDRALGYAPYADLLWLETKNPDLKQARKFARVIREKFPSKILVYNLSPSFNWSAHGFGDEDLKEFVWELSKEGFILQLVSLAGLHSNAAATAELAANFKTDGMLAYVNLVQAKEKALGCDVLTHQKWSGSQYIDGILSSISIGSSATRSTGKDSTESSF